MFIFAGILSCQRIYTWLPGSVPLLQLIKGKKTKLKTLLEDTNLLVPHISFSKLSYCGVTLQRIWSQTRTRHVNIHLACKYCIQIFDEIFNILSLEKNVLLHPGYAIKQTETTDRVSVDFRCMINGSVTKQVKCSVELCLTCIHDKQILVLHETFFYSPTSPLLALFLTSNCIKNKSPCLCIKTNISLKNLL